MDGVEKKMSGGKAFSRIGQVKKEKEKKEENKEKSRKKEN